MITVRVRSFHPRGTFGTSGLGFSGDSRGFTTDETPKSRIRSEVSIDLESASISKTDVASDPSHNLRFEGAWNNWNMEETYDASAEQPTGVFVRRSVTPYRKDGDQAFSYTFSYRGKNHALLAAGWEPVNRQIENLVVPDLDVTYSVAATIRRDTQEIRLDCTLRGDGFPNAEAIFYDTVGKPIFLVSHIRVGTASNQLFGNRRILMGSCSLIAEWLPGDRLGSSVRVLDARDHAGAGSPSQIGTMGQTTVEEWNQRHTGRDAIGPQPRRNLDDSFPNPFRRQVGDPLFEAQPVEGLDLAP